MQNQEQEIQANLIFFFLSSIELGMHHYQLVNVESEVPNMS